MITVKICKVPGQIKEVVVDEFSTIDDAIDEAGITTDGCAITVNGDLKTGDEEVEDGMTILVTQSKIKGA